MTEQNEFQTEKIEVTEETELAEVAEPKKSNESLYLILLPVLFLFGLVIGYLLWGSGIGEDATAMQDLQTLVDRQEVLVDELAQILGGGTVANNNNPAANPAPAGQAGGEEDASVAQEDLPRYDIEINANDPTYGPKDAPVVIIEYSDFQCPYCQRHNAEVKPQIIEKYGDNVLYIYKDFPLTSIHPAAIPAAEAALCAHEQGGYEAYHELLFSGRMELNEATYVAYAEEINLDMDAFNTCVAERRYADEVQADLDFAVDLGVRSTPTFFINGIAVVGAQPFEVFESVIDTELAQQ